MKKFLTIIACVVPTFAVCVFGGALIGAAFGSTISFVVWHMDFEAMGALIRFCMSLGAGLWTCYACAEDGLRKTIKEELEKIDAKPSI